jgi:putative acetyltransferase
LTPINQEPLFLTKNWIHFQRFSRRKVPVYPTEGLPDGYCELVKLYLHAGARGKGIGKKLLTICFSSAQLAGYTHMYLETMPELNAAIFVYEQTGFTYLTHPLGNSGHHYCSVRMVKKL